MTDALDAAERRAIELAGNLAVHDCRIWRCNEDYKPLVAAIRDLRREAFNAGLERAADKGHEWLCRFSKNRPGYHDVLYDADGLHAAIRSLAQPAEKESPDGR